MSPEIKIWALFAGLGLFLFGMSMLEESVRHLAGRSFKKFLRKYTNNRIQAVISGGLVTMLLQSSSMVTLLVMSFAGAGLIGLQNGIGMIMGANLGTTITGWLVTILGFKLDIGAIILPFVAIGGLGSVFLKSEKLILFCRFLLGFSLMFLGLDYMKDGFTEFANNFDFSFLTGKPGIVFFFIGFLLTAAIHSSSASMMIYLSILSAGIITIDQGFYLVLGSEVGTTVTAIVAAFTGSTIKRKVGWAQFTFNVINGIITVLLIDVFKWVIIELIHIKDPLMQLVAFHSSLNFVGIVLMLPFLGAFTRFIDKIIPDKDGKQAKRLASVSPVEGSSSMDALEAEADSFLKHTLEVNSRFLHLTNGTNQEPNEAYAQLKTYEAEVVEFYTQVLRLKLSHDEAIRLNALVESFRNATLSAKYLKDVKHNLEDLRNSGSDHLYDFHRNVHTNQELFYKEIFDLINHPEQVKTDEIIRLEEMLLNFYRMENVQLQTVFLESKHRDMDMPSLLNMLRVLNNSNEAIVRAIQYRCIPSI